HIDAVEHVALLEQEHELVDQGADASGVGTLDGDLVAADEWLGVERRLDEPEKLVALPEEPHHEVVLGLNLDLSLGHGVLLQSTRRRCAGDRWMFRARSPWWPAQALAAEHVKVQVGHGVERVV